MDPSEINNPFDAFISSTNAASADNNVNIQVETVTISSHVSPIQPSESVMNYEWPQIETGVPGAPLDWTQYAKQRESTVDIKVDANTANTNTSNVIPTNSQTVTPSEMNDLVNNLDINANHNFTSSYIDRLAY